MIALRYEKSVFVNFPFDSNYEALLQAIVFAVYECGFKPRCALEEIDSGVIRIEKIYGLIENSQFGIHDISCTALDASHGLPRFNMPFELGIFLGAKRYGSRRQRRKKCLILDEEPFRYQKFISDISGQDIQPHHRNAENAIAAVRGWLSCNIPPHRTLPGADSIWARFQIF